MVAVECTAMNVGHDIGYEEAKEIAKRTINGLAEKNVEDHECIDVQIVRSAGVRPLPMRVHQQPFVDKQMIEQPMLTVPKEEKNEVQDKKVEEDVSKSYKKEEYKHFKEDLTHISIFR